MSVSTFLESLPNWVKALTALLAAATVGWGANAGLREQVDVPHRLASLEATVEGLRGDVVNGSNLSSAERQSIAVRLNLAEETLCTEEVQEIGGARRKSYCEVVEFIRLNGVPSGRQNSP